MEPRPNFKGLVLDNQTSESLAVETHRGVSREEALRAVGAPKARALAVYDGDENRRMVENVDFWRAPSRRGTGVMLPDFVKLFYGGTVPGGYLECIFATLSFFFYAPCDMTMHVMRGCTTRSSFSLH